MHEVVLPFAFTRLLLLVVLLFARVGPSVPTDDKLWRGNPTPLAWLNAFDGWDAGYYLWIARDGYVYNPSGDSSVAFAPLYPLCMRLLSLVLGGPTNGALLIAGLLISNMALLVALGFVVALLRLDHGELVARRVALYLLVFPATVFLSAVYPHSLFLACSAAAVYCARRGNWMPAGVLGALAALARPYGVLLAVPLAYEYTTQAGCRFDRLRRDGLALGLVPAAFAAWAAFLWALSGNPWLVLSAGEEWGRRLAPPWEWMSTVLSAPVPLYAYRNSLIEVGLSILFFVLLVASWRVARPSIALFGSLLFVPMISTGFLASTLRYDLELLPAFVALAAAGTKYRAVHWGFLVVATLLAVACMAMFSLGYWVA